MVADIRSGYFSSAPFSLTVFNNELYFRANVATVSGEELWVYDGINAPSLVADIAPGTLSSNPFFLIGFKNALYFEASDDSIGNELWKYSVQTTITYS